MSKPTTLELLQKVTLTKVDMLNTINEIKRDIVNDKIFTEVTKKMWDLNFLINEISNIIREDK